MSSIKNAEAAYAGGDLVEALRVALAAWRETRAAAIAEAVEALSTRTAQSFTPPEARTNAEFQKRWLATLEGTDPVAGTWLAETLFVKLPGSDNDQKLEAFEARLRALRTVPPDPRLARALVTLVAEGAAIVRWAADDCRKTLTSLGDERTGAALEALAARAVPEQARLWRAVRGKLAPVAQLSDGERAAWEAIGPRPDRRATGDARALFDAVLAAPEELSAREVLADCLQGLGDPRGEFITLQLAELRGAATIEASKRADALLKQHKKEWLGALASVTYRARFRGGFLDELELDGAWRATKKAWEEYARDPLLSTVTYLHGKPTPDFMALFVGSPLLRALEIIDLFSDPVADALERAAPPRLRELRSTSWKRVAHDKRFRQRVVPIIEALPTVERIELTLDTIDALMESRAWPRIRALKLYDEDEAMVALWRRLPAHVTTLAWNRDATLRRAADGALTLELTLADDWDRDHVGDVLAAVRPLEALAQVIVTAAKRQQPPDEAFAPVRRAGLTVERREPTYRSGLASGLTV